MTSLRREDGSSITLGQEIAKKGGEGKIYAVVGKPDLAAKIYHTPTAEHAAKLQVMLAKRPIDYIQYKGHVSIAWPEPNGRLFDAQNRFVGFLMPYIHPPTYLVHTLYNPQDRQRKLPGFTWQYLLHTASNFASVLEALHQSGYVVGDLNESNILVSAGAQVTLIDCDSMQISRGNGLFFRCKVGRAEYTPPELQGLQFSQFDRRVHHDNFGLAVLIFLLLMEGKHPFTGVWQGSGQPPTLEENIKQGNCSYTGSRLLTQPKSALPFEILPYSLRTLMVRCFVEGYKDPQSRPTAYEWHQALADAEQHLISCSVNGQHRYSQHLQGCPWCQRKHLGLPDPFPPRRKLQSGLKPVPSPPSTNSQQRTQVLPPQTKTTVLPRQPQKPIGAPKRGQKSDNIPRRAFLTSLIGLAVAGSGAAWLASTYGLPSQTTTVYAIYKGHTGIVQAVSWSPDGKSIASASSDKTAQVWGASTGKHVFTYHGHSQTVRAIVWSHDGKRIASASDDRTVQVWDAATRKHILAYHGHGGSVSTIAWSPNGKFIASGSSDKTVQVWDTATGRHLFTYHGHSNAVSAVAWSPNGKRIVSGSRDRTVQVWDATTGKHALTYRGHSLDVFAVAWSPDGKRIASGGADKLVQIWDAASGKLMLTYGDHYSHVTTIAWSPDGKRIASGEDQMILSVGRTATAVTHKATPKGGKSQHPTPTVGNKSTPMATPTTTGSTVQVWEVVEGGSIFFYRGHIGGVNAVTWSPDGGSIASAGGDKTVQVWQAVYGNRWL